MPLPSTVGRVETWVVMLNLSICCTPLLPDKNTSDFTKCTADLPKRKNEVERRGCFSPHRILLAPEGLDVLR